MAAVAPDHQLGFLFHLRSGQVSQHSSLPMGRAAGWTGVPGAEGVCCLPGAAHTLGLRGSTALGGGEQALGTKTELENQIPAMAVMFQLEVWLLRSRRWWQRFSDPLFYHT